MFYPPYVLSTHSFILSSLDIPSRQDQKQTGLSSSTLTDRLKKEREPWDKSEQAERTERCLNPKQDSLAGEDEAQDPLPHPKSVTEWQGRDSLERGRVNFRLKKGDVAVKNKKGE